MDQPDIYKAYHRKNLEMVREWGFEFLGYKIKSIDDYYQIGRDNGAFGGKLLARAEAAF